MGKVYPKMTVSEYINSIPEAQKPYIEQIRKHILEKLDPEFQECVNYGMLGYVVPHSKFPEGYHCDQIGRAHV